MGFNPGGGGAISAATDVAFNSVQDDQVLTYDAGSSKWQNQNGSSLATLNAQTGTSYTLVLADLGRMVTLDNSAAVTLTVPNNTTVAYPVGSRITFAQLGAGQVTVVPASGVTINADPGLKIAARYGAAELVKIATNTWLLVGRLAV